MSIIINGAGVSGTILALVLSKLTRGDLKIFLIEQNVSKYYDSNSSFKISSSFPPNIIALSQGSYSELMQIDVNATLSSCSGVIKKIEISSEYSVLNKVCINAKDYQLSELGYIIELNTLRKKLFDLLSVEPSVTIYCPAIITKIRRMKAKNIIVLDNGCQISAKLMVAADGAYSALATSCGMQWLRKNYQQIAVVTTITTEIPHYGQAFEKFTAFGSLALLPIYDRCSFLIWCISNNKKEIIDWNTNKFSQELQNTFGWTLGKILNVERRYFYDLWLIQANSHILHRLALVGNAAQNLHPIAGQGFNLGLRDVITLAKIIVRAFYNNKDIGSYSMLYTYQKHRYVDQCTLINITDGLVRLFNNDCLPLVIVRNLGLFFLNYNISLKRLLTNTTLYWNTD